MKIDAATLAIVNAWDTTWTSIYGTPPSVPYFLDNEQAVEPNPPSAWVRLTIKHETGIQSTQGRPARYYRRGRIYVQIFTPINAGRKASDLVVESAITALEAQTIGPLSDCVTTYGCSPNELPADAQWMQCNVVVPFDYWEQH